MQLQTGSRVECPFFVAVIADERKIVLCVVAH